ncbi:glycosyltransferase [Pelomonas sp. KK5]|uniref:glycosyltransferase n=1 Tax=Pelomonas sp. KK5 TaxID=1855730 RepID=UPI00097C6998|nr:glycosyltransferase [Pelomonas sp. KK5]
MSKNSDQQRHILCMKWGTKYGPEYVNRLYAMVRRHLKGDFTFVCLTDRTEGIRAEVQCFPIPEMNIAEAKRDGAWKKLTTFEADLYGLKGTALFLDLDVVIVDDITPFFEVPGKFLIIHDWKRPWRVTGNSSVYRFKIGAHADVLDKFRREHEALRKEFRNEQAYLSDELHKQGLLQYWDDAWCASWKYHCVPRWPLNFFREPFIPAGARILIFHGVMNPPDALAGRSNGNWRKARPAPWIAEHWRE